MTWHDGAKYPWSPSPDPKKPPLPYNPGFTVEIQPHTPPLPFGDHSYVPAAIPRLYGNFDYDKDIPQSEWCLEYPPFETPPPPPGGSPSRQLCIVDQIACKDGRGAQIVRCYLDQDKSHIYVAKIFDALYYPYQDDAIRTPVDVTMDADSNYSCEAAAYEDIRDSGGDGKYSPKYHGSWTFKLPLLGFSQTTRPVRMVLMEWIRGVSLQSLIISKEMYRISPKQRLNITAKAMEAYSYIQFYGVWQRDFAARNIILRSKDYNAADPDVAIIDFNLAEVQSRGYLQLPARTTTKPIRPWQLCSADCIPRWETWVPEPHYSDKKVAEAWCKARWERDDRFEEYPWPAHLQIPESPGPSSELVEPYPDKIPADLQ